MKFKEKISLVVKEVLSIVLTFMIVFAIVSLTTHSIFQYGIVDGESMNPTFQENDIVAIIKYRAWLNIDSYNRGDIVVFHYPIENGERLIKRIIGIEGDKISITGGRLYVNNTELKEDYIQGKTYVEAICLGMENQSLITDDIYEHVVPKGEVYLLGDHRNNSYDSRYFSEGIPLKSIIGKAIFKIRPFDQIGKL